ncbi:unnamed protein product [Prorocentrum cordatum]|uniref:PAS domain-containing protein n=1 Tax=Prorocentrum cordatum TaxID=2364126 RepID=A0ABN9R7K6_9DINO|nr:unnamed protein product [Polarella glacialis]
MEQPLLDGQHVDEGGNVAAETSGEESSAQADTREAANMPVYSGHAFGDDLAAVLTEGIRRYDPRLRPGYEQSLTDRRGVRTRLLPAVALSLLMASMAREGGMAAAVLEVWMALACLLGAAAAPVLLGGACTRLQDLMVLLAAVVHTRQAAASATFQGPPTQHLVMFWTVAMPMSGTGCEMLACYAALLLALQLFHGEAFVGSWYLAAAMLLAAPVVASENQAADFWERMQRGNAALQRLLDNAGGAHCAVDVSTGNFVSSSESFQLIFGAPAEPGQSIADLAISPHDKDGLGQLLRTSRVAASASSLEPLFVASLRLPGGPSAGAVAARLVPYSLSDGRLHILVQVQSGEGQGNRVWVKEQAVAERETRCAALERALAARDACMSEQEKALSEMHELFERRQGQRLPDRPPTGTL